MHGRQPIPRLWLMTDERLGDGLERAIRRLPRGAGVVFRHYSLPKSERRRLFERIRGIARRRRLVLVAAGGDPLPGDGAHNRRGRGLRTASAHNLCEVRRAERDGVHLIFLSPVFATASHPGGKALGPVRFGAIAGQAGVPVVALGGLDGRKARRLHALGAYGWAGVGAFAV